jgi:TonB-linked SusC/RagA family outer membrane protein
MKKKECLTDVIINQLGKLIKITKLATIMLLLFIVQVSANSSDPHSLNLNGVTNESEKAPAEQQTGINVTGKVADSNGASLPGVSVVVKGTNSGVITDNNGSYSITNVPENATLQFSFVGMKMQEVQVGGRTSINVTLSEDAIGIEEVVAIGYATQKKVSLTSAVATVKGEVLTERTVSNVPQALQGNLPGLTVLDQGASPGNANMVLRIRGITTLSNNDPLVIVDGIEQRINDINPRDIETVTVLKDASSTAIYGSRASNGVVLITTKRAKAGNLSITYSGYYALQKSVNSPVHMGLEDYMRLQNVAWTNSTGTPIYTESYIQEYLNTTDRLKYPMPNTYWEPGVVLHTAPQINHSLNISGGNETIKALLSVRMQDQNGIIANSESKMREFRLNTDFKISPKITISTDINYQNKYTLAPINEGNVFYFMLQNCEFTVPKFPDGTYGISSDGHNPLLYAEQAGTQKRYDDYLFGNLKASWEIIKGLTFSTQLGARIMLQSNKNFANKYTVYDYYNPALVKKTVSLNNLNEIRNDTREYTINNLLNYSTTLGDHSLNVLVGYSEIENKVRNLSAFRQAFYNNDIQSLSQGANDGTKNNSGNDSGWGLRSYFSRVNYSFQDKYLFEANGRYDGSSRFISGKRYGFFPSYSAGWRISKENFWAGMIDKVNELKLRGSYGLAGNQAVSLYSYLATLNLASYSFNNAVAPGYRQTTLANQNLSWETTAQTNIGLDAQLMHNRLSLTVDYYKKNTTDILLTLPVPATLGLGASPQNAGRVDNEGWEFVAGTQNRFGQFGFDANVNFNINNNKVVDLAGTGPYITGGNETRYITGVGYPINSYWGYLTDGYFQSAEDIASYPNMRSGLAPGDVKFVDRNKDGKITADDMTYLGQSFPKYTFGSSLNFSYKNFSLNLLLQGVSGYKARIGGAIVEMGIWGGFTHELITNNYWTPDNRNARFPRPLKYDLRNIVFSDRDLQDGSYLRLKNIQLMYEIPTALTKKVGIQKVSVYVATTNLLTFASLNEWNIDPETAPGTRAQAYPQTSITSLGLNINF